MYAWRRATAAQNIVQTVSPQCFRVTPCQDGLAVTAFFATRVNVSHIECWVKILKGL